MLLPSPFHGWLGVGSAPRPTGGGRADSGYNVAERSGCAWRSRRYSIVNPSRLPDGCAGTTRHQSAL
jgi:hypothetical protein